MPLLKKTKGARVVATSSVGHRAGNIDFTDIVWETRKYNPSMACKPVRAEDIPLSSYSIRSVGNI